MNKKIMLETLVAAALAISQVKAHAAPISLKDAVIQATYNGTDQIGHLSHGYLGGAGNNVGGLDPNDAYVEFATTDNLFFADFDKTGLLSIYANNPPDPLASYTLAFDFGSSLSSKIGKLSLVDGSGVDGTAGLSVGADGHTITLAFNQLGWNEGFVPLVVQIEAAVPVTDPSGNVPEPATLGLMLAGAAGLARARARRRA